ncbi:MAG: Cof-type HAD-IIB family hydrolase [Clostridiales bacterium]|jgi:Cof subfamily protein (haloacid dehalogenase superfamily)|nr:Cof-type HAD-IIB family hydrolase [Clostridiales bacterium]
MGIKVIVTNLDSTLLRSDRIISDYTVNIFNKCKKQGIKIVFATDRSENSCKRFTDIIKPDAIVSNGGSLARIGGKNVYRAVMDSGTADGLIQLLLKQPAVGCINVKTDTGNYVNEPIDINDPSWFDYFPVTHVDFTQGLGYEAYKITVEISDEATANGIAAGFPSVNVIRFSGEDWYRFADKNAGKWQGVKALAVDMGVDEKNIAAFGDDYNDLEMLRECGTGVAVMNGIDEVKTAADYICGTNDNDGVAKWLKEKML